ncbi:MAG: DUF4338 domain-containing protein [Lentisphaeria bacterium]|jgi:hypothetical protein|nr:DUF4338 domain-containing protein [Lentisphaeria bacterium]
MDNMLFRYRGRELGADDLVFLRELISQHYHQGRSHISRVLCEAWSWRQPNGKLKEFAARDLLLRLEEHQLVQLPARQKPKNNLKPVTFPQIPLFPRQVLEGCLSGQALSILPVTTRQERYLWNYLVHRYHYLGLAKLVGEHIRYLVWLDGQVAACLGWASAAWKVQDRDRFIGWDEEAKRRHLHLVANNVRFLIPPWIRLKNLASKVLSLCLHRLCRDWQDLYGHPLYLAETFVDTARFSGTCYQAANWLYVGQTKGSGKRGNGYHYHGQPKAIYLYPLHRRFRRLLGA